MQPIAIFGVTGRMGQALLSALRGSSTLRLCGAAASSASARLGQDAASDGKATGVPVTADPRLAIRGAVVAVDFSLNTCVAAHAQACAAAGVALVVGATDLDAVGRSALEQAARNIPVLVAPNLSVGVSVVAKLVAVAAAGLGPSYDVEIFEAHHRLKRDAPSGTALALGEVVAQARSVPLQDVAIFGRAGQTALRTPGSIGFASMRAGDIAGDHTVIFASAGERVEITHRATDRSTFAQGALRAAEWLIGQPAGLYGMQDVLGL